MISCFRKSLKGLQSLTVFPLTLLLVLFLFVSCSSPLVNQKDDAVFLSNSFSIDNSSKAISPVGTANGKKILFDNTHGETAGAADWVIDGAFSDFGNALANKGYYVAELRKFSPITIDDLTGYDVFVIPEANIPFKTSEQAVLLQYVQAGGSIFFIADHYNADRNKNRWDASEVFNGYRRGAFGNPTKGMSSAEASCALMQDVTSSDWLGTNFGVRFRYNALGDISANVIVAPSQAFNITQNVSSVAMHAGATIAILDPTKAKGIVYLPTTSAAWANAVDQGVYNGGGKAEGPFSAVAKIGAGKAAFIGDSSPVEDASPKYKREENGSAKTTYDGFKEVNDGVFLTQLIDWLAVQESYTSLTQVSGLTLDTATALLAIETPLTSTEPQAEPWAAPASGYKWYDRSTFKSGSYGYGTVVGNTITATISSPSSNVAITTGSSLTFTGSAVDSSSSATLTYKWTFSDGTSATSASTTKTFTNTGSSVITITATFTATDNTGATGSASRIITVNPSVLPTSLYEGFENATKGSYTSAAVNFASGSWYFTDSMLGNSGTDRFVGKQSARMRNSGKLTMKFDSSLGAKTVTIKSAKFGTDSSTKWSLWYSTNAGSTWTQAGSTITTSSTTLTVASFTVNVSGTIRFEIRKTDGTSNRLNIDEFTVVSY